MKKFTIVVFALCAAIALSGCYRPPTRELPGRSLSSSSAQTEEVPFVQQVASSETSFCPIETKTYQEPEEDDIYIPTQSQEDTAADHLRDIVVFENYGYIVIDLDGDGDPEVVFFDRDSTDGNALTKTLKALVETQPDASSKTTTTKDEDDDTSRTNINSNAPIPPGPSGPNVGPSLSPDPNGRPSKFDPTDPTDTTDPSERPGSPADDERPTDDNLPPTLQ